MYMYIIYTSECLYHPIPIHVHLRIPINIHVHLRIPIKIQLHHISYLEHMSLYIYVCVYANTFVEGSLEAKLPTIWTDEKQSRAEAERKGRLEERRSEEKE